MTDTAAMPKVGEICWNELATGDVQGAKEFYGKVFGWEFQDHEMGDMTYTMIKVPGKECGGGGIWAIPKEQQEHIPPHWMSYILVENLEESVNKAIENGANVIKPAMNVGDYGRMAIFADPTGAHIAIWQNLKSC